MRAGGVEREHGEHTCGDARRAGGGRTIANEIEGHRQYAIAAILAVATMSVGAPAANALTISPLSGTPDASPHTQISFLGIVPSEIREVSAVGSRSGSHSGRLKPYASAPGASFLPARPFTEGEQVTVSAVVGRAHHEHRVGSTFTVARLAHYRFEPMRSAPAAKPGTVQSFASQPGLSPPSVRVTARSQAASADDVFITANNGFGQWGPMIFDRAGGLVWFKPTPKGETAMDLQVESYEGKPVLVWWQGYISNLGIGFGTDEIYSSTYRPIASVRAGNGYWADLHEIQMTPKGAAFITAYSLVEADLSSVGGAHEGALQDSIVQEVDIKTGLVMFEWHTYGHVALEDSYSRGPDLTPRAVGLFPRQLDLARPWGDGNFLISSRNTWAGYEVDGTRDRSCGASGGKHSSFHMGPGTGTAWQHDIRWQPDHTITLFDDGAVPGDHSQSRAIQERIDWRHRTVSSRAATCARRRC